MSSRPAFLWSCEFCKVITLGGGPCPSRWNALVTALLFFNNRFRWPKSSTLSVPSISHIPGSTLCRNPLQGSTHSQDSGGGNVRQTSWCCTGKKLWSGQSESLRIPCPELPYTWSLKGKKKKKMTLSHQNKGDLGCIFPFLIWKTKTVFSMFTQSYKRWQRGTYWIVAPIRAFSWQEFWKARLWRSHSWLFFQQGLGWYKYYKYY